MQYVCCRFGTAKEAVGRPTILRYCRYPLKTPSLIINYVRFPSETWIGGYIEDGSRLG